VAAETVNWGDLSALGQRLKRERRVPLDLASVYGDVFGPDGWIVMPAEAVVLATGPDPHPQALAWELDADLPREGRGLERALDARRRLGGGR
jgi:hypothetical protein